MRVFHLVDWYVCLIAIEYLLENTTTASLVSEYELTPLENKLKYKCSTLYSFQLIKGHALFTQESLKYLKNKYLLHFAVSIMFSSLIKKCLGRILCDLQTLFSKKRYTKNP